MDDVPHKWWRTVLREVADVVGEHTRHNNRQALSQHCHVVRVWQIRRQWNVACRKCQSSFRDRVRHTAAGGVRIGPHQHLVAGLAALISRLHEFLSVVPHHRIRVDCRTYKQQNNCTFFHGEITLFKFGCDCFKHEIITVMLLSPVGLSLTDSAFRVCWQPAPLIRPTCFKQSHSKS